MAADVTFERGECDIERLRQRGSRVRSWHGGVDVLAREGRVVYFDEVVEQHPWGCLRGR